MGEKKTRKVSYTLVGIVTIVKTNWRGKIKKYGLRLLNNGSVSALNCPF